MKNATTNFFLAILTLIVFSSSAFATTPINGSVLYHMNSSKPIPSVNLQLTDLNGTVVAQTITSNNGTYSFPNIPYGTYTLTGTTSISAGGITIGDGLLILLHIFNLYPFTPIQELAADLDGDGSITFNDYTTLVIGWFLQGYPFPIGDWTFQDLTIEHSGAKTNVPTMGGSSSGDVNGTFVPTGRSEEIVQVSYIEKHITSDFNVEIFAQDITSVAAMGLVIDYPQGVDVTNVTCQLPNTNFIITKNQVRINWVDQTFMSTTIDPTEPILVLTSNTNKLFNGEEIKFEINSSSNFSDLKGEKIETRYIAPMYTINGDFLSQNYPNPVIGTTSILFNLPCDSKVSLSLYNQQGQLVLVLKDEQMGSGDHRVNFSSQNLPQGIYFYTLRSKGAFSINETKRLIVIK